MGEYQLIEHKFDPVFNQKSKVLLLGTLPSVKSRYNNFYYGHPQNRFWKLLALLKDDKVPDTIDEKKQFLLRHGIAIWDVIKRCEIIGSSDSSIKNVVPCDINSILVKSNITNIYANGAKAYELYNKYCYAITKRPIFKLPSTSPANAGYSLERLAKQWEQILIND